MKPVNKEMLAEACQPHKQQSQQLDKKEIQRRADHLWDLMSELYTDKWIKKNGAVASSIWMEAIASLTPEQLRDGVEKCKKKIFRGDTWAPDLADFLAMIHGHTDIDYHAAFMRCLNRKPEGKFEQWVNENVGYNIRTSTHEKAERLHKKSMLEAIELDRRGELRLHKDMFLALPPNSVKNANDLAREEYEAKNGKMLNPRIQAILDSKKAK